MRVKRKQVIHNVHILDRSGSMAGGKYNNALEGINGEQKKMQENEEVRYTQTVIEFYSDYNGATHMTEHSFMRPIKACETVIGGGANGGTPLYETVGVMLEKLLLGMEAGDKVLVTIFTDGDENASHGKYKDGSKLKELVSECESKGFTVTFVGTEGDVYKVIRDIGISKSNTFMHMNTPESVNNAYMMRSSSLMSYTANVSAGADVKKGFFNKED